MGLNEIDNIESGRCLIQIDITISQGKAFDGTCKVVAAGAETGSVISRQFEFSARPISCVEMTLVVFIASPSQGSASTKLFT